MTKAALCCPRRQRVKQIRVRREHRASLGEFLMQVSSPFHWLEECGPACQLIAVIDDANNRIFMRLVEHDSTEENLRIFGAWLRRNGRPLALYTDKTAFFAAPARRHSPNNCTEKSCVHNSDGPCRNWASL